MENQLKSGEKSLDILIISDNPELSSFFLAELDSLSVSQRINYKLCYSALNKSPKEMSRLGGSPIDVKDPQVVSSLISKYKIIFSVHCKQIFPDRLVNSTTCINVHPGYNPYNRGWYPQAFSLINNLPAGATIHLMDESIDGGEVIAQSVVAVDAFDTSLEVYLKILEAEKRLIRSNLSTILQFKYETHKRCEEGNYNSVSDYKELCRLNLDSVATLREHLSLLRATSHGEFKNAYFVDENGQKVYVKVHLSKEC